MLVLYIHRTWTVLYTVGMYIHAVHAVPTVGGGTGTTGYPAVVLVAALLEGP